jgi:hypothetical protein
MNCFGKINTALKSVASYVFKIIFATEIGLLVEYSIVLVFPYIKLSWCICKLHYCLMGWMGETAGM